MAEEKKDKAKTEQKIQQLQSMEQTLQGLLMQKQQFQSQELEINSALEEIEKTDQAYKIVGNVMIFSSKDELKKDLQEKKEVVTLRLKTIEKQENSLREKSKAIQSEVMKELSE